MPEYYGALPLPTATPTGDEAAGDPALRYILEYLQAVLNAECTSAVSSVWRGSQAVVTIFAHDPGEVVFNERDLPALFLYRESEPSMLWEGHDWRIARDQLSLLWVMPPGVQGSRRVRMPLINAIIKCVDKAIESYRHPAWVATGETDPTAATLAADIDAIKTSVATSTSPQSYSGAALNGVVGNGSISPAREFTVTCSGADANFVNGSVITATGLDLFGNITTRSVIITHASIPGTFGTGFASAQIAQIDVPAQVGTGGTFSFGLGSYAGKGSFLFNYAPHGLKILNAKPDAFETDAQVLGKVETRHYDCLKVTLESEEKREYDLSQYDALDGADVNINRDDGSTIVQGAFE